MKKFNIDYKKLQTGDLVLCAGNSPFAIITRMVTAGRQFAFKTKDVAVHVGTAINIEGEMFIAEMQPKGLEINSFVEYLKEMNRRWIIDIRRSTGFDDSEKRIVLRKNIIVDLRHSIEYDYKGLLEFVFKRVKDDKKRMYCSEYHYHVTRPFVLDYPAKFNVKVSPYDLQNLSSWTSIPGWKI